MDGKIIIGEEWKWNFIMFPEMVDFIGGIADPDSDHFHLALQGCRRFYGFKQAVDSHPIVIFMKGTPQMPMCGYSSRTAQMLQACDVEFAHVNVLADPEIFENLPRFANWPTFPQVYVNGELIGGHDITLEMFQKGELKPLLQEAAGKKA